jgi:hypothetical protein
MRFAMQKLSRMVSLPAALMAAIAVLAAPPALAALPFEMPFTGPGLSLRDWVLMGSLVLLAVALALRLMRHRGHDAPLTDTHDLRWWHNP